MKHTLMLFGVFFCVIVGCSSSPPPAKVQPTTTELPTAILPPTQTIAGTRTPIPFPTSTPSVTPIASITPQSGFEIWHVGSVPGVYTIQYPAEEWTEESGKLIHSTLTSCSIAEYGGSDLCMAGGCPEPTDVTLGDVVFRKMAFRMHAIYTAGGYFALSFEAFSPDDPRCIGAAEKVLDTLQIRPERGCTDRAAFVADVTIPDNTVIPAGTNFIKTWRLKNVGTCIWTKRYILEVHGKSSGTEADWVALPEIVPPQQTTDISIELPAPLSEGIARWEAVLKNEFGDAFGLGSDPYTEMFGKPFSAQIIVGPARRP